MEKKKIFNIKTRVWVWPGIGGWHFVNVDKKISAYIREAYGVGMIKIRATIKKTSWDTSLFPHKNSRGYLLCVKKSVRKSENIFDGDEVSIRFEII